MRFVSILVVIVVGELYLGLVSLAPLLAGGRPATGAVLAWVVANLALVVPPLILAGITAMWDFSRTDRGRRAIRRGRIAVLVIGVVSAVAAVVAGVLLGIPWWAIAVAVALPIALQIGAVRVGDALRPGTTDVSRAPIGADSTRRTVRAAVIAAIVTLLLSVVGVGVLSVVDPPSTRGNGIPLAAYCVALALIVSSIVVVARMYTFFGRIGDLFGHDPALARRVARSVLKGKGELNPEEVEVAAPFAAISGYQQRLSMSGLGLLFGGILLQTAIRLATGGSEFPVLDWGIVVAYLVVLPVVLILGVRQVRRAEEFARAHPVAWVSADAEATD